MFPSKIKGLVTASIIASMGLSACVVSDNPYANVATTTAAIGVASMLFYSLSDGYYYDQSYNRMPRHYQPASNVHIQRVNNMDEYRRQYPQPQYQQRGQQRGGYAQPAPNRRDNRGQNSQRYNPQQYDRNDGYGYRY